MYLKLKNHPIARIAENNIQVLDRSLLPLYLRNKPDEVLIYLFPIWLKSRRFDFQRTALRQYATMLSVKHGDAMLFNRALSLTDCYWLSQSQDEKWEDFSLYRGKEDDVVLDLSLNSKTSAKLYDIKPTPTGELTNLGSFNKAWKKERSNWYMIKNGSPANFFSELFSYYLGMELGFNLAEYSWDDKHAKVKVKNFTNEDTMLSNFDTFSNGLDEYTIYKNIGYLVECTKMVAFDILFYNIDRHEQNHGVLLSANTGEIKGFSPLFDHNLAFPTSGLEPSRQFMLAYLNEDVLKVFEKMLPTLTPPLVEKAYNNLPTELKNQFPLSGVMNYMNSAVNMLYDIGYKN